MELKVVKSNKYLLFGRGAVEYIPEAVAQRGLKRGFVVTDAFLLEHGVAAKVTNGLDRAGAPYSLFSDIVPNPTIENVRSCLAAFQQSGADYIVAVGGGSPIDTAKAVSVIAANPELSDVRSLEGRIGTKNPPVRTFAVPTTAGTATEVTDAVVITDTELRRKFISINPASVPNIAVVDPVMMESMPRELRAATGADALTHAIEALCSKNAWSCTDMYARTAIEAIFKYLPASLDGDGEARLHMAEAQYVAGMAFSNAGLGLCHAMSHPLGAVCHVQHGAANAVLLPHVMRFNAGATGDKFKVICRAADIHGLSSMSAAEARERAIDSVAGLMRKLGLPGTLRELGVKLGDFRALAGEAMKDATITDNPRDPSPDDVEKVYKSAR